MKNCFRAILLPLVIVAAFGAMTLPACTEVDDTLGQNFLPKDQEMGFGSSKVSGINSYLAKSDSIVSSRLGRFMLGRMTSDRMGKMSAGAVLQFTPAESNGTSKTNPYGTNPVIDSADLFLQVESIFGDPSVEQKFYVYRFEPDVPIRYDSVYYGSTYDADRAIDRSKPLFSFTMKDEVKGGVFKSLTVEDAGHAFLRELVALDPAVYELPDTIFRQKFQGFYIAPSNDPAEAPDNGAIYNISPLTYTYTSYTWTDMETSHTDMTFFAVYVHNDETAAAAKEASAEKGETVEEEGVYVTYSFDDTDELVAYPNTSIVIIGHDYTGSEVDPAIFIDPYDFDPKSATASDPFFVQGFIGVSSYLHFSDEFVNHLQTLRNYDDGEIKIDDGALVVNKAVLRIYLEDGSDIDILDNAPRRLGMYYSYKGTNPENIPDYMYIEEAYYDYTSAYGGQLNRALGCYEMDISMYVRALANKPEETQRGIWLAPAVPIQFEPREVALLNGASDPDTRMEVQLYYTIVRKN